MLTQLTRASARRLTRTITRAIAWAGAWARTYAGLRSERGSGSNSAAVLLLVPVIILVAGMVVDGGRKASADAQSEATANAAARAGADAAASSRLVGRLDTNAAVTAAQSVVAAQPGMTGTARMEPGGTLHVTTAYSRPTVFLGIVGIDRVHGSGDADAVLVQTGGTP